MRVVSGTIYGTPVIAGPTSSRRDARVRRSGRSQRYINEEARDYVRSLTGTLETNVHMAPSGITTAFGDVHFGGRAEIGSSTSLYEYTRNLLTRGILGGTSQHR